MPLGFLQAFSFFVPRRDCLYPPISTPLKGLGKMSQNMVVQSSSFTMPSVFWLA
jgi:hypothetical protein